MLAMLTASLLLMGPSASTQNSGSALISKMLQYYSDAHTMTGTITYTASDGKGQVQLQTQLQFEKPSKLFLRQTKVGGEQMQWLVTSDGTRFSYDTPDSLPGGRQRLTETVRQVAPESGKTEPAYKDYDIGQIYAVAATGSLGDRSVPLDIAIGRLEDLKHDNLTWMTVESGGKVSVQGMGANEVHGAWREYGDEVQNGDVKNAPGMYHMVISDEGKLLRYVIQRTIGPQQIPLTETWEVNLSVNGKPDPNLFKLVR